MMDEPIKDGNEDQLAAAIEALKPKCLDDIIRKKRDKLQLLLANETDIQNLHSDIDASNPKDIFDDWSLIAFVTKDKTYLRLIGEARSCKKTKMTSIILKTDMRQKVVSTLSGNLYQLGTPNIGEPDLHQRIFICTFLHDIWLGPSFGVPEFFY